MQTYREYSPTGFDSKGLRADDLDIGEWLVVPCGRNRDSEILAESNFHSALAMLGGESETVQVHRFGHWACGWLEIILINPMHDATLTIGIAIECRLENGSILNEDDHSERESAFQSESWEHMSVSDRVHECQRARVSIFAARHEEIADGVELREH